ncbi:MAG: hypothetical protein N4A72_15810 [Bacteroidales bacterium]|nr:hypothetical protein [Bacteroidales bacterium]
MLTLFIQSDKRYLSRNKVLVHSREYYSKTDNPLDETKHEKKFSHKRK